MSRRASRTEPSPADIGELVALLPRLSAPGFKPVISWGGGEETTEGAYTLPWPRYDAAVEEFRRLASAACWTDRGYDSDQASRMLTDEDLVRSADLSQIRTMLTYCVRGERFCDGHLGEMIEKGYAQRLLQRLKEIS